MDYACHDNHTSPEKLVGYATSSARVQGSRPRNVLLEVGEPLSTPKRSRSEYIMSEGEPNQNTTTGRHIPNSGRGHSAGNSSLSSEHSHKRKSKKRGHGKVGGCSCGRGSFHLWNYRWHSACKSLFQ